MFFFCAIISPKNCRGGLPCPPAKYINDNFIGVMMGKFIVMPNHIHLIVNINDSGGHGNPPLRNMVVYFVNSICFSGNS